MFQAIFRFLIMLIACSLNERMQKKLDYTQEEVRILKEVLATTTGKHRIPFTDKQRRRLALKGKDPTAAERRECCELVTPATLLAWFRRLVAQKYDGSKSRRRGAGRPRKADEIRKLVIELALANLSWGYTRIRDALRTGLGIDIGRTTVASILNEAGIEPAPERAKKRTWKQFMKSHWDTLYACDFFSWRLWAYSGRSATWSSLSCMIAMNFRTLRVSNRPRRAAPHRPPGAMTAQARSATGRA